MQCRTVLRVGILTALKLRRGQADIEAAYHGGYVDPSTFPIASPWSSSSLERIIAEDVFGSNLPSNTRAAAVRIPTVKRARNLVVSAIQDLPMFLLRRGQRLPALDDAAGWEALYAQTPAWMYRCTDGSNPQERLAWTVDDLMFYEWSCWWRVNGTDGFPIDAGRVNQADWRINDDNQVELYGTPVRDDEVIVFRAHGAGGILADGRDVLDDARTLYRNVRERLANPVPVTELHQTTGKRLTKEERTELIAGHIEARRRGDGIGYTSPEIEMKTHGSDTDATLMVDARNAMSVDLARLVGISAGMVDATAPKASLNYETKQGRNEEFSDRDLDQWITPIVSRLSMDDVVPIGSRTVLDRRDLTGPVSSPTGPDHQD